MMMQEYKGTNNTITNGYKLKTFTSTLSKKGDFVEIITCRILGLQPLIPFLQYVNWLGLRFVL